MSKVAFCRLLKWASLNLPFLVTQPGSLKRQKNSPCLNQSGDGWKLPEVSKCGNDCSRLKIYLATNPSASWVWGRFHVFAVFYPPCNSSTKFMSELFLSQVSSVFPEVRGRSLLLVVVKSVQGKEVSWGEVPAAPAACTGAVSIPVHMHLLHPQQAQNPENYFYPKQKCMVSAADVHPLKTPANPMTTQDWS